MNEPTRHDAVEVYRDRQGTWRWRCVAPNGRIVADSGEGYSRKGAAVHAAHREADARDATVEVVEPEIVDLSADIDPSDTGP